MTTTTEHSELIEANRFLADVAQERTDALWEAIRQRDLTGAPIPPVVSDRWEKANAMLAKSATTLAMNSPVGTLVITPNGGLIVTWIMGIEQAMRLDREIEVILTEDGDSAIRAWHQAEDGLTATRSVRYEVYTADGRVAHGYIDQTSRKIVQTG